MLRSLEQASLLLESNGRYRMHDLIRLYAGHRTDTDTDSRTHDHAALTRLINYYLHMTTTAANMAYPHDKRPRQHIATSEAPATSITDTREAMAWLDNERPNLVAVTAHSATHGWPREANRLAASLYYYLNVGAHHREGLIVHEHGLRAAIATEDTG